MESMTSPQMKPRTLPQTSAPQIVRRFRVDSAESVAAASPKSRKPSLRFEELPAISTMNGFAPFSTPSSATGSSPGPGLLSPIPNGGTRRASGFSTPIHNGNPSPVQSSSLSSNLPTSPSEDGRDPSPAASWSVIGHAGTTGKSGRVIERLMAENDKLKRELNAQIIKSEELQRNLQTYKPQIDALRAENDNLSHARGVDSSLMARRDRRIDELKTELRIERERREHAEKRSRQLQQEKDAAAEQTKREVQMLTESTKHATVHAEIMETSHRQLAQEYRTRAEGFRRDMQTLQDGRQADQQKLSRLEVVYGQMRQELERHAKLKNDLVGSWQKLKQEDNERMGEWITKMNANDQRNRNLHEEVDNVVHEMKWLMGVKKVQDESMTGACA